MRCKRCKEKMCYNCKSSFVGYNSMKAADDLCTMCSSFLPLFVDSPFCSFCRKDLDTEHMVLQEVEPPIQKIQPLLEEIKRNQDLILELLNHPL